MEALHWMRWFIIAREWWPYDYAVVKSFAYASFSEVPGPCDSCRLFTGKVEKLREED